MRTWMGRGFGALIARAPKGLKVLALGGVIAALGSGSAQCQESGQGVPELRQPNSQRGGSTRLRRTPERTRHLKPILAILDFESNTLGQGEQDAFTQAIWAEFYRDPSSLVLPLIETRHYLMASDLYPGLPYAPQVPLDQVARALDVDYIIWGHVNQVEDSFAMDYSIFSAPLGRTIVLNNIFMRGKADELLLHVPQLTASIIESINQAHGIGQGERAAATETNRGPSDAVAPSVPITSFKPPDDKKAQNSKTIVKASNAIALIRDTKPSPPGDQTPGTQLTPTPTPIPMVETPAPRPPESRPTKAAPEPTVESTPTPTVTPPPDPPRTPSPTATPRPPLSPPRGISEADRDAARKAFEQKDAYPAESPDRIRLLEKSVMLDHTVGEYKKALAWSYCMAKEYEKAINMCLQAERQLPNDSILYTIKGSAYFEMNQYDEAREAHEQALRINPNNHYSRYNRALVLQAQGSPRAIEAWESYLAQTQDAPKQQKLRAEALKHLEKLKKNKNP